MYIEFGFGAYEDCLLDTAIVRFSCHALVVCVDIAESLMEVTLSRMLIAEDKPLGPWASISEPLGEQMMVMRGGKGGPQMHPWEAGMGVWGVQIAVSKGSNPFGIATKPHPFPQPKSLVLALTEIQLTNLGLLIARVPIKNKVQILEVRVSLSHCISKKLLPKEQPIENRFLELNLTVL